MEAEEAAVIAEIEEDGEEFDEDEEMEDEEGKFLFPNGNLIKTFSFHQIPEELFRAYLYF